VNRKPLLCLIAVVGFLALGFPLFAHHGNSAYNNEKTVTVKDGTVTEFVWANPHSLILFDAKDANGKPAHWVVEGGSPSALSNLGWTRSSLQPGEVITVELYQSKLGTPVGRLNRVLLSDGKELRDSAYRSKPGN
jgi:hypothetical protein